MKIIKRLLIILLIILIALGVILSISPYPVSLLIRKMFDGGLAVAPENFEAIKENVIIEEDLEYPSQFKSNTYDMFTPKNSDELIPTIIWIHGGAFVGGDKHDIYEYATQIANEGYRVISMNYDRAPEAKYPTPLIQVGELTKYVLSHYSQDIKEDNLFYAGDSAGAHIASQFAMIQNDGEYAKLTGIEPVLPKNVIKGMLLYCGPYDISSLVERTKESKILDFFAHKIAWAYLGDSKWKSSDLVSTLSIIDYVNEDFPASFITDGNKGSFMEHGEALASKLESFNIPVVTKFYPLEIEELIHEYQFKMNLQSSIETMEATLEFLNTYK